MSSFFVRKDTLPHLSGLVNYSDDDEGRKKARDSTINESKTETHAPWLLRRTSIHVESTPAEYADDISSEVMSISTTHSDKKNSKRAILNRLANRPAEELHDDRSSIAPSSHNVESTIYGTTVSIEAGKPKVISPKHSSQRELKNLEQAASIKHWTGAGQPAEIWGKLLKDPELWDPSGDTLIYFGYQRPEASFRIKSSMLEATHSDLLIGKLQDGLKRNANAINQTPGTTLPDMKNLSLGNKMRQNALPGNKSNQQIRYEIHFPPPDGYLKVDILRYHITTRNFLALLLEKPLVGLTLFQALVDLHSRLQHYLPKGINCAQILIQFLIATNSHNVCNDPAAAAGLLAWSEDPAVHWFAGWREGFVHCCGMYTQVQSSPAFHDISQQSRTLLARSHVELGSRIRTTEEKLSSFNLDEIWVGSEFQLHPSRAIFDQFRRFLLQFYIKATKQWPPQKAQESDETWLTRNLVWVLQKDFGALYDYHVDRSVIWSQNRDPVTEHRNIIRANGEPMEPSRLDISLAKLFTRFDQRHQCPHIPHPYPLLPAAPSSSEKQARSRFFHSKSKEMEKRTVTAFAEASNGPVLRPNVMTNGLLEAFLKFEKSDNLGDLDPQDARRARWILLYGILQILATLSIDVPDLFFYEGVSYFLNPRMTGTPPWEAGVFKEASPRSSYCWKTRESWMGP